MAVDERKEELSEHLFAEILKLEPDNFDVPQLKLELKNWKEEEEKKRLEEEAKKVARKKKVDQLAPGKNEYLKKNWYQAVLKLENFLKIDDMDEDLLKGRGFNAQRIPDKTQRHNHPSYPKGQKSQERPGLKRGL